MDVYIPIKIGALDLDIGHAIVRLALALAAALLFLVDSHVGSASFGGIDKRWKGEE